MASLPYVHRATVFYWYNIFLEGRESIHDEQKSGIPMTTRICENITRIADILKEDCWSSCTFISEWMGIPKTIVQQISCEDLQKWKLCVWFVPHALPAKQKEQCLNQTYGLIEMIESNPNFLNFIITGDESWCFAYDLETKCQSSEWYSPNTHPPKNFDFKHEG